MAVADLLGIDIEIELIVCILRPKRGFVNLAFKIAKIISGAIPVDLWTVCES